MDDWNELDHFDPTVHTRRIFKRFFQLREVYGVLQDGFGLRTMRKWTRSVYRPGSNGTATETGAWLITREELTGFQNVTGQFQGPVLLMYTNENTTTSYTFPCKGRDSILTPFTLSAAGSTVRNLFYPYETYTLQDSGEPSPGRAGATLGCIPSVTLAPYGFKAFVPASQWVAPAPAITKFTPGHDHRMDSTSVSANVPVTLEFNTPMTCTSVTNSISFRFTGKGSAPTISNVNCAPIENPDPNPIPGGDVSAWSWSATLQGVPEGITVMTVTNPSSPGNGTTGVSSRPLLMRHR